MKHNTCLNCGADVFIMKDGFKVCKYCNSRYEVENVINNSTISLQNDIDNLLKKCRENPSKAYKYASLILDIDPTNREARKYL